MNATEIGATLQRLRGKKSRLLVATDLGISKSALTMYEKGNRIPRDEIKVRISEYFGISIQDIFFNH